MARIPDSIGSNSTGLSIALETTPGKVPDDVNTKWLVQEPNEYGDFGAELSLVARNPINADRRRKKGTTVGLTASGGWTTDLTARNLIELVAAFLYAPIRSKDRLAVTSVAADGLNVAGGGLAFVEGTLISVSGSDGAGNNGLHTVGDGSTGNKIDVAGLTADPGAAFVQRSGFAFPVGDASIVMIGARPSLQSATIDMQTLGLNVGEIVFIGGDDPATQFATPANRGFARVFDVTDEAVVFDKTDAVFSADLGTGKGIHLYFGTVVKDERATEQVIRTYTLRRTLGRPDLDVATLQSETISKATPNTMNFALSTEDKITAELMFMAGDYTTHNDDSTIKGVFVEPDEDDAINTASDLSRVSMMIYQDNGATAPLPVFAAFEEVNININNNVSDNKALGHMGSYALTPGMLEVGGDCTAYFASVDALAAVRQNKDVTFMLASYKNGRGVAIDLPMIALGTSGLDVSQDDPIMMPLDSQAATGKKYNPNMDHTALFVFFDYLPAIAAG